MRYVSRFLAIAGFALFGLSQQASASVVLYDNGPINGTITSFPINFGWAVSDSFTLSQPSTVTGVNFGAWNLPGDTTTSVDWGIANTSATYTVNGTAAVTSVSSGLLGSGFFPINTDSFATGSGISLGAGTYYLVLQNAVTGQGNAIYWDQNNGPSTASLYNTQSNFDAGSIGSQPFQIIGNVAVTPLPSTWMMLLSGFVGLGFLAYRGTKKNSAALAAA